MATEGDEPRLSGSADGAEKLSTQSGKKGGKSLKLVEMPSTFGRDRSASDKKWNFVDDPEDHGQFSQSAPMYFTPQPVVFVARRPAGEAPGAIKVEELQLQSGVFMAKVSTYGAALLEFHVPDAWGQPIDVLLGAAEPNNISGNDYMGGALGRVAGRIAGGTFSIDTDTYTLAKNDGNNSMHGGTQGWNNAVWEVANVDNAACSVTLAHTSPDGDEGYPGEVQATITFSLNPMGVLRIEYGAEVKGKPSPVDMGHTLFWNLAGQASGPEAANQHAICLAANKFIVMNEEKIPTGEQQEVQGQAVDLKETKTLETALKANGDDCFEAQLVLDQIRAPGLEDAELHFAASLQDVSGRYMEVHTSAPVLNFQTSFSTGSLSGKGGAAYVPNGGICLRTQGFPDAVNQPEFPSMTVAAGETYSHVVEYRFFCGQFY